MSSGESGDSNKKTKHKFKNEKRLSRDSRASSEASTVKKTLKRSDKLQLPVEKFLEEEPSEIPSDPSLSTISLPPDEVIAAAAARVQGSVTDDLEGRAARRARGKSVYLSCFAGIDSIYFIIRLVVFLRVDIFHDTWQNVTVTATTTNNATVKDEQSASTTVASQLQSEQIRITQDSYFCGDPDLEAQCAWIFSVTWMCYFLANVSLIMSILWLSLKLCYAYIFMKTTSIIIHFLGLLTFGYHCLSQKFYIETGVFFIFHLPLQIFGTKRTKNYAISLKRAEMEKIFLAHPVPSNSEPASAQGSGSKLNRKKSIVLQRRKSYQVVTTVDE